MEQRQLGQSGLYVPALGLGTGTFGGQGPLFSAWGDSGVEHARRMIDICLDAGLNLFDSADVYSDGASETVLGAALQGRRSRAIISTKIGLRTGPGAGDWGSSRQHLHTGVNAALARLQTDYIDLLQLHAFDAHTPIEETLRALHDLVQAGKVRHIGVSNFSGWQLMKSLQLADQQGLTRYAANQAYYSLVGRDFEWELMPLGQDQSVGTIVWSPLGWGRLTGKICRGQPLPAQSRLHQTEQFAPPVAADKLYQVLDALETVAQDTGKTVPQIAINWLLQRPTVASVLIGARNEEQLKANLGAVGWQLSAAQLQLLDDASAVMPPYPYYPYWNGQFSELAPSAVRSSVQKL